MIRRYLMHRRFMREHHWTQAHLSEYVDEDLAAEERERVAEHMSVCPQCHRVLATLRRTLAALRDLGKSTSPPVDLRPAVIERLRRDES